MIFFSLKTLTWLKENLSKLVILLFGFGIILYAIFSSKDVFSKVIQNPNDLYSLLSPSLIFLFVMAIKLLAGFWIFAISVSIFNWEHISEQGAKIFGVEISQKFNRQELNNARAGIEIVKKQIKLLSNLHDQIYKFSVSEFKKSIFESDSIPDKVRNIVNNILVRAYQSNFPKVQISVLP